MKKQYKCSVDGIIAKKGKHAGVCPVWKLNGMCGAHGNKKCEHKRQVNHK